MTRAERAALREQRLKDHLAATRRHLAQVAAQNRAAARTARHKRRFQVGLLADQAGLFALDDAGLARLFAALSRLVAIPDPVATLEGLLCDAAGQPGTSVEGMAHAAHGVSPAC